METCCSRFTAAEGGTRLAAVAQVKNTIITEHCFFVATRLLHEDAFKIRGLLSEGCQRSIYLTRTARVACIAYELSILTDLSIAQSVKFEDIEDWNALLEENEVLICTSSIMRQILERELLSIPLINVLIIDSCHLISTDEDLKFIMSIYSNYKEDSRPRLLALTYPLFTSTNNDDGEESEANIENREDKTNINDNSDITDKETIIHEEDNSITSDKVNCTDADKEEDNKIVKEPIEDSDHNLDTKEVVSKNADEKLTEKAAKISIGEYENVDDFEMYEKLGWKIEELERELNCEMDLAEDIDGGKRLSAVVTKPKEVIIEYRKQVSPDDLSEAYKDLEQYMRGMVQNAMDFINEHRYDPSEIYGEDLYEEFVNIPDPTQEPKELLYQFLYILDELGPYAADKAAFSLLTKLEKLKIKVPYERHFLLLCMCSTLLIKIRSYADFVFSKCSSDWEKIQNFSTSKVLRFAEILEQFEPPLETKEANTNNGEKGTEEEGKSELRGKKTTDLLNTIESCDFTTLGNRIEDRVNMYEANLKDLEDVAEMNDTNNSDILPKIVEIGQHINLNNADANLVDNDRNLNDNPLKIIEIDGNRNLEEGEKFNNVTNKSGNLSKIEVSPVKKKEDKPNINILDSNREKSDSFQKNCVKIEEVVQGGYLAQKWPGHRIRGRGRVPRNNTARLQQAQLNPDALCGIVFMKEPLMAKIMFMLIVDLSRCRPPLNYLCAQYCAVEATGTELQECQRQNRKQEDVLKKFRMHECNLLLATSALEEGIDLPRCNLVVRWDLPPSYRSHALCRSRARAPRSALALLAEFPKHSETLVHHLAVYRELDQIITRKCGCGIQNEPPPEEENNADTYNLTVKAYTPIEIKNKETVKKIDKQADLEQSFSKKWLENLIKIVYKRKSENNLQANDKLNDIFEVLQEAIVKINERKKGRSTEKDSEEIEDRTFEVKEESNLFNDKKNICDVKGQDIKIDYFVNEIDTIQKSANFKNINVINELIKQINNVCIVSAGEDKSDIKMQDKTSVDSDTSDSVKRIDVNSLVEKLLLNSSESGLRDKMQPSVSKNSSDSASVDLNTAIALINRYCGKLPSDTFTRLAPQWWMEEVQLPDNEGKLCKAYICTLRLPLNCPVKYNIVGHPMPTRTLARRMVALQACRILHKSGELDNQLMPIGKENFKAAELETTNGAACVGGDNTDPNDSARPGTTKRRQYYFKRTAWAFTDCQPVIDTSDSEIGNDQVNDDKSEPSPKEVKPDAKRNTLYAIDSRLWCALPERYNTRGRRLHAPQNANQAIGILMARQQPDKLQIPSFPVYTRSGEVRVSVQLATDADVRLSPHRARLVRRFMRFVFSDVLRVRRRGMKLQNEGSTHNNYYIVPTIKTTKEDGSTKIDIDWAFLELIYQHTEEKKSLELGKPALFQPDEEEEEDVKEEKVAERKPRDRNGRVKKLDNPLLKPGETFVFDPEKYREAVVTPWYRNQDQPQFFLVAEICWNLTPDSAFPSATHTTFRDYYSTKYGVVLTQPNQPLLDVDHTSARLNLLTPRYVNRKGVALPVSSERTRRAKRDRLDQKQILVPELCRVHPFAAPLWFATVALPCVLYRINALLIADEIRRAVAIDVGLGIPKIDEATCPRFQWPPLDFGWSLSEVLSADSEKVEKKKEEEENNKDETAKELRDQDVKEKVEKEEEKPEESEAKEKTINDILQEKEDEESGFEIGTWSNDMASSIPETVEYDEYMEPLPPNLTFCTTASGGTNWSDPIAKPKVQFGATRTFSVADSDCSYISSDFDTDDSDMNSEGSDEDTDTSGFCSSKNSNAAMGVRIEYKTAREAEAVDVERGRSGPAPPQRDRDDDERDVRAHRACLRTATPTQQYIEKFRESVAQHGKELVEKGFIIDKEKPVTNLLPDASRDIEKTKNRNTTEMSTPNTKILEMFPYGTEEINFTDGQVTLESIERNKRLLLDRIKKSMPHEEIKRMNCFSMVDVDVDSPGYVNEKVVNVGFDTKDSYVEKIARRQMENEFKPYHQDSKAQNGSEFDFDYQPNLEGHPGPSPSVILQALTMSNANDGINLERLETIGDSFLKFAITAYLYCAHPTVHEGKLSHMRSKQVSNLNLYRLGRNKRLGARMIASKFEPHDNWLPPCHKPPPTLYPRLAAEYQDQALTGEPPVDNSGCFIPYNLITQHSIPDKSIADCVEALIGAYLLECGPRGALLFMSWLGIRVLPRHDVPLPPDHPYIQAQIARDQSGCTQPNVRVTQKSTQPSAKREHCNSESSEYEIWSDEEEGETEDWQQEDLGPETDWGWPGRAVGSLRPYRKGDTWVQPIFGELRAPPSPLLRYIEDPEGELEQMLSGYDALERTLQYRFKDRSLLLQALTHASHNMNRLTDCYQRLEFLGDAILDYLITRHLYEDARRHSPGALTDLRSALVNNTIFATLAARHGFHKYFRHMSPGLNEVLTKYVKIQEENGHSISEEHYLIHEDEMEQAEDVEVPKALGDLFESVAGAIFLDSGMSLGAVWRSYVRLMGAELEAFSAAAPKSPVRELLEAEPDTAKFGKPERLADGRRVRVCVEVFGRGAFKGVGRNYRIAKGTAARCALRHLKAHRAR